MDAPQVLAASIAAIVSLITATVTALVTVFLTERKLRRDFQLEFAAERVAHAILMNKVWRLRSFDVIKRHLGGFDDNALRQILVRAGAIQFQSRSGKELWGLLHRNEDRLGVSRIDAEPGWRPSSPDEVQTSAQSFDEDGAYSQALKEVQAGTVEQTVWSRAFAEADGIEAKTRALYIKLRVERMRKEM